MEHTSLEETSMLLLDTSRAASKISLAMLKLLARCVRGVPFLVSNPTLIAESTLKLAEVHIVFFISFYRSVISRLTAVPVHVQMR